jgi:hypothetical protein
MEFHSRLLQSLPETRIRGWNGPLPFYMTYPGYDRQRQEELCLKDLEYLEQLYPEKIRRWQRRIAEILDKTDYEGSMIYDEYPDKYSLRRLAQSISGILQSENETGDEPEEEMVQVLLYDEIYKRRHGSRYAGNFGF